MRAIFEIHKKELLRWSKLPAFYVLFALVLFGENLYIWFFHSTTNNSKEIMPIIFQAMFWGIAFAVPILAMGVFIEERKNKTLQILLTRPIRISQIIIGKFCAVQTIIFAFLGLIALSFFSCSNLPQIVGNQLYLSYLFLLLEGVCYTLVVMLIGSFVKTYWKGYLYAYFLVFLWHYFFHFLGEMSVGEIQNFFFYLSLKSHFNFFLEGGFALSTLVYLLSISSVCFLTILYKLRRDNL